MLRVHLHGSKLTFKLSFKTTKVDAAVKMIYFGLKRIFSYPLNQPSNQPLKPTFKPSFPYAIHVILSLKYNFGLKVGLKAGLKWFEADENR